MDAMLRPMMNMYLSDPSVRADIERMVSDFLTRNGVGFIVLGIDKVEIGNGNAEFAGAPHEVVPALAMLAYQELGIEAEPPDHFRSWLGDLRESMGSEPAKINPFEPLPGEGAGDDPVCVCGVHHSEHTLAGCGEWEPRR